MKLNLGSQLKQISAVGIGTSLGGLQALQAIFSRLSVEFPLPIFVVQHIPEDFEDNLAACLRQTCSLEVLVARDGERILPSKIYLAPGHTFMEILKNGVIKITPCNSTDRKATTISCLFHSMAKTYANRGLGIILTGMGRDGVDGLLAMKKKGAITIAQSQEDCLMYGMPKEAVALGAATHVVHLQEIAPLLNEILHMPPHGTRNLDDFLY